MPTPLIEKLAKTHHMPIRKVEAQWDRAKALAARAGQKSNWGYIVGVFKRLMGATAESAAPYAANDELPFHPDAKTWEHTTNDRTPCWLVALRQLLPRVSDSVLLHTMEGNGWDGGPSASMHQVIMSVQDVTGCTLDFSMTPADATTIHQFETTIRKSTVEGLVFTEDHVMYFDNHVHNVSMYGERLVTAVFRLGSAHVNSQPTLLQRMRRLMIKH